MERVMTKETEARASGAIAASSGRYPREAEDRVDAVAVTIVQTKPEAQRLMEAVVSEANMRTAYRRVRCNRGAAGVDGMTVDELREHLRRHWQAIKEKLLVGRYIPQPVKRVEIPKPQGGMRGLGIPTVTDRLIQQALNQVLQGIFEPGLSASSYGFRPQRSALQAVEQAQRYVAEGKVWVVDIDLEAFFDRVNHDILMSRVARQVEDKRVLKLIRRYLQAGTMAGGTVSPRAEGTPQGGPLSPLLSNILLTDLDREIEKRGLSFCRYADDCNVYVKTQTSGERVMAGLTRFLERKLKLKVNPTKSAVAKSSQRKFLGYTISAHTPQIRIAAPSLKRFKIKLKGLFRIARGCSLARTIGTLNPVLRGWINYYQLTRSRRPLEALDQWIRRRLRAILWRQWKRTSGKARGLIRLGIDETRAWTSAGNGRGPWWNANAMHMRHACPSAYFERLGLLSLVTLRFPRS